MAAFPDHWGTTFTSTIHSKAEGPTAPENNKLPSPFVVVVTGAGKGLGYGIALAYASAGASGIVIASRTEADLSKLKREISKVNPDISVLLQTCDTTKAEDVQKLAEATKAKFGRLDVVVANAGVISGYIKDAEGNNEFPSSLTEDPDFEHVINTNFLGSYRMAKHFIPQLIATKDGPQAFVVISSVASHITTSSITPAAYNLTKLGVNRMAEHIHYDHQKDGVQAFAVHPGGVVTPQTELHHTTQQGKIWNDILVDDVGLCGGFLTWLTKERREWLSGRYLAATWDVDELVAKKDEIVSGDKLTFKMAI